MNEADQAEPDRPAPPGVPETDTPASDEPSGQAPVSSASLAPGARSADESPSDVADETITPAGPATTGVRLERLFEGLPDDEPSTPASAPIVSSEEQATRRGPSVPRFSPRGRSRSSEERTTRQPRRGYRVRRVRRLLRHVEPWSVLKTGLVFYLCVWGMAVIASQALWRTAETAGVIEKVERFIEELFALETFAFDTDKIFRLYMLAGLVLVIGGTALTVVLVVLFNLISDLMGGIRFTMIEEETAVRRRRLRAGEEMVPTDKVGRRRSDPGVGQNDDG
ncbi:MAG: DUF3566 domain-containing protein [Acidimicrobiales bacterium]|nr:DUF3566 domain-containing protein [Acidimicrobiales bacterium]MDP6649191.1 DUF3566 domain-containing protein [Acidimicrobiales bacterium]MDP6759228.1 DUF3566 domain-containing protein [Acidimicrobiales bacterium]